MQDKWSKRMMKIAAEVASWSKDPQRKVGCVITSVNNHILATGYNGFPRGLPDTFSSAKNLKMIHAEINALLRLQYTGFINVYVWGAHPCSQCAGALLQHDVLSISCFDIPEESSWKDSMITAREMFRERNVRYNAVTEEVWGL